ncbi:class I SAM-dependent methyltransferase [Methanoculleus sp. FWC-SCC1]|uniref:Class I SAM-dependent methyltransferase n=1 Tax=Methanoculleus frigidifontis TaxID=2584085 RepID=A0ABT8M6Z7_9EURY|nr:class I SAM-dependent methyltransferase [Methanoculleus sp. FWC-SCC1]MDN7023707.1 class I SAM-dependent methyltransferase [Methanoculleus sp. FWC-SCC1]
MTDTAQDQFTGRGAGKMDTIAKGPFAPIYPVIARQILETCGIVRGTCIDLGCGPGHLALALAAESDLSIDAFDASPDMLAIAEQNILDAGLSARVRPIPGDVHDLPYPDGSVDLIVSRGSLFFWEDRERAFAEIYRVLRPGGRTFVGGGFGTAALKAAITEKMRTIDPEWEAKAAERMSRQNTDAIRRELETAGIPDCEVIHDEAGFWIVMRK